MPARTNVGLQVCSRRYREPSAERTNPYLWSAQQEEQSSGCPHQYLKRVGSRAASRGAGARMVQAALVATPIEWREEDARRAALLSTGILDSPPEPTFDAITRLAAEYFHADTVLLGFADQSRV